MATDNRGETIYDKHKLLNLGKMYMSELNERLDKDAQAAGFTGIQDLGGANLIGGTNRPTQLARPASTELPGHGAEAYSDEPKRVIDQDEFKGDTKGTQKGT